MKYLFLLLSIIIFSYGLNSSQLNIEKVRVIEESQDNLLYGLSRITVSEDRFIFISNYKDNSISKYSWDGKFIKKTGQKGGGPGDFNSPRGIDYYKGKIYVNDVRNQRIVILDKDLAILKIIKSQYGVMPKLNFHVTRDLLFVGYVYPNFKDIDLNHIRIIDGNGKLIKSFFNKIPYWKEIQKKSIQQFVTLSHRSRLCIDLNESRDKIVITQERPNNPAVFYFYTSNGKYLGEFKYNLDKDYSFPKPSIIRPTDNDYPKYNPTFHSIFFMGDNILAYMFNTRKTKDNLDVERKLILFSQNGEILSEKILPEGKLRVKMYLTNDRHLLIHDVDDEDNYLIKVYKLTLQNGD